MTEASDKAQEEKEKVANEAKNESEGGLDTPGPAALGSIPPDNSVTIERHAFPADRDATEKEVTGEQAVPTGERKKFTTHVTPSPFSPNSEREQYAVDPEGYQKTKLGLVDEPEEGKGVQEKKDHETLSGRIKHSVSSAKHAISRLLGGGLSKDEEKENLQNAHDHLSYIENPDHFEEKEKKEKEAREKGDDQEYSRANDTPLYAPNPNQPPSTTRDVDEEHEVV